MPNFIGLFFTRGTCPGVENPREARRRSAWKPVKEALPVRRFIAGNEFSFNVPTRFFTACTKRFIGQWVALKKAYARMRIGIVSVDTALAQCT